MSIVAAMPLYNVGFSQVLMRRRLPDLAVIALMFVLPLILFWQQTAGGRTLLPADNLYQYEPYASYRAEAGAPAIPHNHLLSDLVLQNYPFKLFIREQLALGDFPLWNPHQFAGIPFFAAGQQSTLYPLSAVFYLLDLPAAYGWFTVIQLWLAGVAMFACARGLGLGRFGGAVSGITYQLAGFFVVSAVFPMIIAAAAWLPLMILFIEWILRGQRFWDGRLSTPAWMLLGAITLCLVVLAGHVEITYYTLLISGLYAAARLLTLLIGRQLTLRTAILRGLWLLGMVVLGMLLGAVQFMPTLQVASSSFRSGRATFDEILGFAHPPRDLIQFLMPNFFGSPAHHTLFDWFTGQTTPVTINALGVPITHTEWGEKNYVEGALYLGILPLVLAAYAVLRTIQRAPRLTEAEGFTVPFLSVLSIVSLTFMFGLPTYALLYYALPGIDQLHSPFRWVFALTLCVALLAGYGAQRLAADSQSGQAQRSRRLLSIFLLGGGLIVLAGLVVSRLAYPQVEPFVQMAFERLARATSAFANARQFYNYQFTNGLILAIMLLSAGGIAWSFSQTSRRGRETAAVLVIAADLMIAVWGFHPATDPALLNYQPPALAWLSAQPGEWRYTSLDTPGRPAILNANLGMYAGLDDIRGYESIISRQYVELMAQIAPQNQLVYNRIAPLFTSDPRSIEQLENPLLDLLNVRYLMTYADQMVSADGWSLAYEDQAVRIYENAQALPRAFLLPASASPDALPDLSSIRPAALTPVSGRERLVDVDGDAGDQVVLSETPAEGWRAFIRPLGMSEEAEAEQPLNARYGAVMAVTLPESGAWTVRFVYSPTDFQIGAFASFIGGAVVLLLVGMGVWRVLAGRDDQTTGSRVARNSVAPILLNLFNRGIDFAFAAIMLRLLGPELSGWYYYAIVLFGWFDIFTNFGLNLFVVRDVSRDRSQARRLFINTSALRVALAVVGVPLLIAFLAVRLSDTSSPIPPEALIAIALLYVGLLPNSLSTGLTALYYAFERAEVPAAVTTIATLSKAVFGLAALLGGLSIIGLAAASILTNLITLVILSWNARAMIRPADTSQTGSLLDTGLLRGLIGQSYPLMLNHFLATIFFKIDIILIEAIHNARMVGQYSVAYKWVEALNVIPSFFTQALLPILSRQAQQDRAVFLRSYRLGIKLLFMLALPIAVFFTGSAVLLTQLLGGAQFLPDGAVALQLMIWSIPIGWMNSLTQYALIALDLQQRITRAFVLGVGFNIITNLIFIPQYGYQAAALTTIASELVLFIAFARLMSGSVGAIGWRDLLWRPAIAAAVSVVSLGVLWNYSPVGAGVGATAIYGGVLLLLRPLESDEWERLVPLLPGKIRRWVGQT